MKNYYLAYGSNLNKLQMKFRCPGAVPVGHAYINDYRLMFKGSQTGAYLTIEKAQGHKVPVGVWEVSGDNETRLDRYEGCPRFYYKTDLTVNLVRPDGTEALVPAFVYIMHEDRAFGAPTKGYVQTCLQGYYDFGFNDKFLKEAIRYTGKMMK